MLGINVVIFILPFLECLHRSLKSHTKTKQMIFTNNLFLRRGRRPRLRYISITHGICMIGYVLIVQIATNDL